MKDDPDALDALAGALAHPARLSILRELAARSACACGELVQTLPLAQSTVSQHLKVLREAGLIRADGGPRAAYCLDRAALGRAALAFSVFFDGLAEGRCACPPGTCTCTTP